MTAYIHLADEIVRRNGVHDLCAGDEGVKHNCKILVKFLPEDLDKTVKNELVYRRSPSAV